METILAHRELHIERKYVVVELRKNERGKYLKICETAGGRRNIVIIPETGLNAFAVALNSVLGVFAAGEMNGAKPPMIDGAALDGMTSPLKVRAAALGKDGTGHEVKDLKRKG